MLHHQVAGERQSAVLALDFSVGTYFQMLIQLTNGLHFATKIATELLLVLPTPHPTPWLHHSSLPRWPIRQSLLPAVFFFFLLPTGLPDNLQAPEGVNGEGGGGDDA